MKPSMKSNDAVFAKCEWKQELLWVRRNALGAIVDIREDQPKVDPPKRINRKK